MPNLFVQTIKILSFPTSRRPDRRNATCDYYFTDARNSGVKKYSQRHETRVQKPDQVFGKRIQILIF